MYHLNFSILALFTIFCPFKMSQNCECLALDLSYPFDLLTRPIFDLFTKQKQIIRFVIIYMR